jgi:hypothetical protein
MTSKNIIQLHKTYEILGSFERVCLERWKLLNPEWNYIFLTDHDLDGYICDTWPQHADAFNEMKGVLRSQFMRFAAVYRYGGLYADCDCYPIRPLDQFVDPEKDTVWFRLLNRDADGSNLVADYLFYAQKSHPHVNEMIEQSFDRVSQRTDRFRDSFAGYMYWSSGIHGLSDIVMTKYNSAFQDGSGGCRPHDMIADPDQWDVFHYSVESWIPNNRFQQGGSDPNVDQIDSLNMLKKIYGI